jgi:hypothetical protein
VNVKVYVEGGGDHNKALDTECRRGFSKFFRNAGLKNRMPRVVACGGRTGAFDCFKTSHENAGSEDFAILLVDSEAPVAGPDPWEHVRLRAGDGWDRPAGASCDRLHLMVQAMEAWFYADKDALQKYYRQGFRPGALSPRLDIDNIPKADLFTGLKSATRACVTKGEYSKGGHSFAILALIDPARVRDASPEHAGRLFDVLHRVCTR